MSEPIMVSNDAELADALANATGGETIVLRDGKYGKIELTDSFDTPVTLRAENPHGAEVAEIRVDGGSGLTVQGLTIPEGVYAINGASHVTVTHSNIGELFYLKNASHITISDNDIDAGKMGLIINSTQHFVVTNNYIHDAVEDLMRVTSNSYDGLIANNIVYDLHTPDPAPGENRMHPDMFQFFGSAEGTPHDITIRQNLFYDDPATGDFGGQGIFMSDPGAGGYKNILIEENLIAVNSTNTLVMNGGQEGVVIDSNVLMVRNPLGGSNLRLGDKAGYDNSGTTVTNNVYRNLADETRGSAIEGNFELGRGTDPSLFFQNHLGGGDWHDFLPVAGSPIDLSTGLGAADFLQGLIDGDASLGNTWEGAEDLAALWQELYGEPQPALDFSDVGTAQFVDTDADTMFDAGDSSFSANTELGLVVTIDKSHPAAELIDAVQFVLDDGAYTHIERSAPLAMFGDTGAGKFNAGEFFTPGAHSVAINYLDADGNVLHTETVDFDIAAPDAPPVSYEIRVYNADTGELVCDLTDGSDVKLPDEDMNLAFTVVPVGEGAENVQSVRMILNGGEVERVESAAPYSLFGDAGMAQLFGQALRSGNFTLDIALYTEDGGKGEVIGGGETDFNLSAEPDLYEGLSSVDFVDTTSDQIIEVNPAEDALDGGTPLGLVVTIDAGHPAADQVAKVQFVLDNGAYEHTEAHVPYAMFGDSGPGAFNDGQLFTPGAHEVAINYLDADGNTLFTETVTFNVAEPAAPVDPEPDTPVDPIPDNAIYVSNDAELKEALADATGGETIILKDGTYSAISSTRDFEDAITIKAENHLGASIESITLKNAQGFAVDGLDIPGGMSVRDNSSEISVSNSKIGTLLYFRDASYITVHNNEIAADGSGLILNSTHDFTVTHNNIHDAVEDLIRVTGNSYNGLVENNIVSDLLPSLNGNAHGEKTHSDLFQFLAGKDGTPHDITIRQNLFYDDPDTGDFGGQGIFVSDPGAGGYRNILIEDNLISVASPNSITINGGQENVVVQNNTLMPSNGVGGAIIRLGDKAGMDNSGTSVKDNIVKVIGDETGHSEIDGNHIYGRDTDAFEFFEDAMEGGHWSDYLPGQGAPINVEDNVGANEFLKELAEGNTHLGTDWQDNLLSATETVDDGLI